MKISEVKVVRAKSKKPKLVKPNLGHESPHPMQGKLVGEADQPTDDKSARFKIDHSLRSQGHKVEKDKKKEMKKGGKKKMMKYKKGGMKEENKMMYGGKKKMMKKGGKKMMMGGKKKMMGGGMKKMMYKSGGFLEPAIPNIDDLQNDTQPFKYI